MIPDTEPGGSSTPPRTDEVFAFERGPVQRLPANFDTRVDRSREINLDLRLALALPPLWGRRNRNQLSRRGPGRRRYPTVSSGRHCRHRRRMRGSGPSRDQPPARRPGCGQRDPLVEVNGVVVAIPSRPSVRWRRQVSGLSRATPSQTRSVFSASCRTPEPGSCPRLGSDFFRTRTSTIQV